MKAYRLRGWGAGSGFDAVPIPEPVNDEALIRVSAAGLCQSDLHLIDSAVPRGTYPVPFTLGHEIAGTVAAVGPAVTGVEIGASVLVYSPTGCGRCSRCAEGRENYCDRLDRTAPLAIGIGRDGGMAEYVLVPHARNLVPLGNLDPILAAPLADAALTPYHAMADIADLRRPDCTALVIGVGGLGHMAIQLLEAMTKATVIAVDTKHEALELALARGAESAIMSGPDVPDEVMAVTSGRGCDVILDFVGTDRSISMATACLRTGGALAIVGSGGGTLALTKGGPVPQGIRVSQPFWGTLPDLRAVVELARRGALTVEVERRPLVDVDDAIEALRHGRVRGRLVLVP